MKPYKVQVFLKGPIDTEAALLARTLQAMEGVSSVEVSDEGRIHVGVQAEDLPGAIVIGSLIVRSGLRVAGVTVDRLGVIA